jgi:cytochrome oxidase assembly protein ShyY1
VLRTALKPRWLGLLALLLVILVSFTLLGLWQLSVARDKGHADALARIAREPVADVTTVLQPHGAFPGDGSGRLVRATGTYAGARQVLVAPRRLDGRDGAWVVTPLLVSRSGATLPVVRGFVTDLSSVPPAPSGEVSVQGSLAPGESPADAPAASGSSTPVLGALDLSVLVNRWPGDLYNGFVFAVEEHAGSAPGAAVAPSGLERVPPPPVAAGGLKWRNAAYALQWWVFAAFAAYMWFRMVRDDAQQQQQQPERRRADAALEERAVHE